MSAETLLAVDFSTSFRSIAIMETGSRRVLARVDTETGLTGPVPGAVPSEGICACVDRLLDQLHLDNSQVDTLAVGVGPGSYTGIRAAIAFAQGWHLATGLKLAAVSTADALALRAFRQGWQGTIHILIDAQRDEFGACGNGGLGLFTPSGHHSRKSRGSGLRRRPQCRRTAGSADTGL